MIQRIQTVFLALSAIATFSVYFTPIYTRAMEDPQQWVGFGLAVSLALAIILTIFSIFRYSNRKDQMSWVKRSMLLQIIALGACFGVLFSLGGIGTYLWDEAIGTGLTGAGFLLQLVALRFIKKDDDLVRSMDRIR